MAYRRGAQREVSDFVQGGYRQPDIYLEDERAGSAHDRMRDLNRIGYTDGHEGPEPYFGKEKRYTARKKKKTGIIERIAAEIRADKKGTAVCAFCFAVMLVLTVVLTGELSDNAASRREIADYTHRTNALVQANETLQEQLTRLTSSDRIHNLAQNTYGMLRRERAETSEIYVVMPEKDGTRENNSEQKPKVEMLDIFLGMMDRFNIGG